MTYFGALCNAMGVLVERRNTMFIGQGVRFGGTTMSDTFESVPDSMRLEFPVAEELQLGTSIGLSLQGVLPVCIFPRWNFVLRAADQIVNHLDRIELYSSYRPKVIIRTAVPSSSPFDAGPQHSDDFTGAFRDMLKNVDVVCLKQDDQIVRAYKDAIASTGSTILVEYTDLYRNERGNGKSQRSPGDRQFWRENSRQSSGESDVGDGDYAAPTDKQ